MGERNHTAARAFLRLFFPPTPYTTFNEGSRAEQISASLKKPPGLLRTA
jgi:hypothetical protein